MQISELARRAGVTPRVLRHYEEQGLLAPSRTPAGYRTFDEDDLVTVQRIRTMIAAGLSTRTIARYLDCVSADRDTVEVEMCPSLRAELDAVARRLDAQTRQIDRTREALCALTD